MKAFLGPPWHSELCEQHRKNVLLAILVYIKNTGKNQLQPDQKSTGNTPVLPHCSSPRNP
jgi:hypothetical protein